MSTNKAISKTHSIVLPDKKCLLYRRLIFKLNVGGAQQTRDGPDDLSLWRTVAATQYPFSFQKEPAD
jgi:hypothetical protein